ncbi:glutamate 5-kinase [Sediminitomix flava]|uniref:Glutamate 5-kinase n=1 Tax=Sediminitomix flava TaxID=379075 RepID=A0A315ZD80_SEDFL|nr:glutamate 5-kinase [Sediminitomix flava]PWJ43079.1 glutamate 5-kinase [Sediminitomix flava]
MRKPRIVLKVGTSTLTAGTDRISRGKIEDIARQLIELRDTYDIIIVSSGAVATARQFINLSAWDSNQLPSKQALSAIGQPKLLQIYAEVFADFGLKVAQCLMTYKDFDNEESKKNTRNTVNELLMHGFIPVFNENDTVAVEELILGDNDKLSALVATLVSAEKLIIASDVEGLFDKNPNLYSEAQLIREVHELDTVDQYIEERENGLGTGGMTSKISAVKICFDQNIEVFLLNGAHPNFLIQSLNGELGFTRFSPIASN